MADHTVRLPPHVVLPRTALVDSLTLRICLGGVGRRLLWLWRRDRAFPAAHRSGREFYTDTDAVERWLRERGHAVERR